MTSPCQRSCCRVLRWLSRGRRPRNPDLPVPYRSAREIDVALHQAELKVEKQAAQLKYLRRWVQALEGTLIATETRDTEPWDFM